MRAQSSNRWLRVRWQSVLPCVGVACWLLLLAGCGPSPEDRRFIKRLNNGAAADRLKAIAETPRQADAAIRTELLRLFENGHETPLIRTSAGLTLGGLHDPRIVPATIKQLPDAILTLGKVDGSRRIDPYQLGRALAAYGPDALPAVAALLHDPRREIVTWTILHHGAYRRSDRALEVLSRYLDDRDVIYRRAAAFGISMIGHPKAEEIVLRHLADPDTEVRYNLAWALLNCGSAQGLRTLEAQLALEKDPTVRQELAKAQAMIRARPPLVVPATPLRKP